jgi:hypothetical protein
MGAQSDDCMVTWVGQHPNLTELPAFVCWYIWMERNRFLFNNEIIYSYVVALKSIGSFNVCVSSHKGPKLYRFKIPPRIQQTVGWFDGAATTDGSHSGVGGIIKLNATTSFKWTFNTGAGTNNRAELLGVWATLFLAIRLHITGLQIIGTQRSL